MICQYLVSSRPQLIVSFQPFPIMFSSLQLYWRHSSQDRSYCCLTMSYCKNRLLKIRKQGDKKTGWYKRQILVGMPANSLRAQEWHLSGPLVVASQMFIELNGAQGNQCDLGPPYWRGGSRARCTTGAIADSALRTESLVWVWVRS